MTPLITLLAFGVIIAVHEFGHFLGAKAAGIRVDEFAIGFGPTIGRFRSGETTYSLRLLVPLGGFVRMAGADPLDPASIDERAYLARPPLVRMGVIFSGPAMNFLLAILLFAVVYGAVGIPVYSLTLADVVEDLPAAEAGLLPGDRVVAVDGEPVSEWPDLVAAIQASSGRAIDVTVDRNGELLTVGLTPEEAEDGRGIIGVFPELSRNRLGLGASLVRGFTDTVMTISMWISSMVMMITGSDKVDVIGVVGIAQVIGWAATIGIDTVILVVAQVSVIVGLVNLLPIPVLDGSRLVFLTIEAVRGRPVDARYEQAIHLVGFAFLMLLFVVVAYRDIVRLWSG